MLYTIVSQSEEHQGDLQFFIDTNSDIRILAKDENEDNVILVLTTLKELKKLVNALENDLL